jgi:CheY-like chemotaxis protein
MMHILHLEDDGPLREILKAALTAADPSIEMPQFSSAEPALEYIKTHKENINLFILDIRLPGTMNGLEVAGKIREIGCQANIVVTSAFGKPNKETLDQLQCEWMSKPWHIMEMPMKLFTLAKTLQNMPHDPAIAPAAEIIPSPNVIAPEAVTPSSISTVITTASDSPVATPALVTPAPVTLAATPDSAPADVTPPAPPSTR